MAACTSRPVPAQHITSGTEASCRLGAGSPAAVVTSGGRAHCRDRLSAGPVFLRELRIALDPALECPPELAPLIDPNLHSCGTVRPHGARELAQPETGFYFAGMKSYGRAPTFLMMTGYEQVRSIVADIAGDKEAAERVELVLPETGVCSRPVDASRMMPAVAAVPLLPASMRAARRCRCQGSGAKGCGCS